MEKLSSTRILGLSDIHSNRGSCSRHILVTNLVIIQVCYFDKCEASFLIIHVLATILTLNRLEVLFYESVITVSTNSVLTALQG